MISARIRSLRKTGDGHQRKTEPFRYYIIFYNKFNIFLRTFSFITHSSPSPYIRQPEYWEIEVVGCLPGIGLPVLASPHPRRYGADERNLAFNAVAHLKQDQGGLHVHGSVMAHRDDDRVEVAKAAPQGINPAILLLDLKVVEGTGPMKDNPRHFCYKECGCHVTMRYDRGQSQTVEVKMLG